MLDADADICRRASVSCRACDESGRCRSCRAGRTCPEHWCYLLSAQIRHLFVQCGICHRRWWHDTGVGVADRPPWLEDLPLFPASPAAPGDTGWSAAS